jgi:hypothetical protein
MSFKGSEKASIPLVGAYAISLLALLSNRACLDLLQRLRFRPWLWVERIS